MASTIPPRDCREVSGLAELQPNWCPYGAGARAGGGACSSGHGLKLNNGYYAPAALPAISLAIVALIPARHAPARSLSRSGWGIVVVVLSIENVSYAAGFPDSSTPGVVAVVLGGVLATMPVTARIRGLAVGVVELITAHWQFSRRDVVSISQRGATQPLHGTNPYLARYTAGTGPHFTYSPATAIWAAPAAWL